MSDRLRIALVAEGPTDRIVIEAALRSILGSRPFVLNQLQPVGSVAFGPMGSGWSGVYRWCQQAVTRGGGHLRDDSLVFLNHDILLLHLDADVASDSYSDGSIEPPSSASPLPCAMPCPPASATTNALRDVLLSWCGETAPPPRTVLCMPSKNSEAWVVAALFPDDPAVKVIECHEDPEGRLGQQKKGHRVRKSRRDYQDKSKDLEREWPRIAAPGALGEALRFQDELLRTISTPGV